MGCAHGKMQLQGEAESTDLTLSAGPTASAAEYRAGKPAICAAHSAEPERQLQFNILCRRLDAAVQHFNDFLDSLRFILLCNFLEGKAARALNVGVNCGGSPSASAPS